VTLLGEEVGLDDEATVQQLIEFVAQLAPAMRSPLLAEATRVFDRLRAMPWLERAYALGTAVAV
jgi:hypothetical protein